MLGPTVFMQIDWFTSYAPWFIGKISLLLKTTDRISGPARDGFMI